MYDVCVCVGGGCVGVVAYCRLVCCFFFFYDWSRSLFFLFFLCVSLDAQLLVCGLFFV